MKYEIMNHGINLFYEINYSYYYILYYNIFYTIYMEVSQLILASDFTKKHEGDLGLGEAIILKNKKRSYFWGGKFIFGWADRYESGQYEKI